MGSWTVIEHNEPRCAIRNNPCSSDEGSLCYCGMHPEFKLSVEGKMRVLEYLDFIIDQKNKAGEGRKRAKEMLELAGGKQEDEARDEEN